MLRFVHLARHELAPRAGLVVLASLLCAAPCGAQDQEAGAPGDWLSSYRGARSVGIGGALVATGDDPLGVVRNPATLHLLLQNELHFETSRLFEGTSINSFSLAVPGRRLPSLGFTVLSFSSGEFERTSEFNEPLGTFQETNTAFLLSASKAVHRRVAVGTSVKVIRQGVEEFGATGVGADFGVVYQLTPQARMGVSVLNLGGPHLTLRDTEETYPHEIRAGASMSFLSGRGLLVTEIDQRSGLGQGFHGGGEFWVHPRLALRFGYDDRTAGWGLSCPITPAMQLDYGIADHELGLTHRIGFSYRFGGFSARSEAVPPVFSPLAQPAVTQLQLTARTRADAQRWHLEITDRSNHVVRRFSGNGAPPPHVMWDGKDETGLTVPDGTYQHSLVVIDAEGREMSGPVGTVDVTTAGPQGIVPVQVR